jgi:hypothetical protein
VDCASAVAFNLRNDIVKDVRRSGVLQHELTGVHLLIGIMEKFARDHVESLTATQTHERNTYAVKK